MSDLNVATTAEIVASDLGLPFTIVPWTPPLVGASRPSVGLRRALALLDQHGGGLLVAHVVRDAVGLPAAPDAAQSALAAALREARVAEVHAVRCDDGLAVIARVLPEPVVHVPADRVPVEGAEASDLRLSAPEDVGSLVSLRALAAVDEGLGHNERLLVAAGALVVVDGELVPTVAGLVAFGRAPWERLGGLRVQVVDGVRELLVVSDGPSLPQRVVRALRIREPNAVIVRALLERAMIERAWEPFPEDDPIVVVRSGSEIEVRWVASDTDERGSNSTLRRLLRAAGGLGRLAEGAVRIADRVEARGGEWLGEDREGGDVVARVVLPPEIEDEVEEEPAVVAPVLTPVARVAPPDSVPVRDLVAPSPLSEPLPPVVTPLPSRPAPDAPAVVPSVVSQVAASDREAAVLALIDAKGQVTSRDVIEGLGWSRSTTRDVIARMVALGRLASIAPSPRSPFQAYVRA
jgi:hypothetical protein